MLVDYTGTIWTNQMERRDTPDRDTMLAEIEEWETRTTGTHVLGRLGFENAYGLAMPRARAEAGGFAAIGDLAARGQGMTIGGDPEFFERPEWIAVRDAYGLRFAAQRNFSPTFMYNALQSGEADVIGAYTSDGRIAADDLVFLDDPEGAFPNYDAIILLSPENGRRSRHRRRPPAAGGRDRCRGDARRQSLGRSRQRQVVLRRGRAPARRAHRSLGQHPARLMPRLGPALAASVRLRENPPRAASRARSAPCI